MSLGEVEGFARLVLWVITSFIEATEYLYKKLFAPGITFIKRSLREQLKSWRSEAWSVTEGAVEWASGSEGGLHWSAEVAYSYRVSGGFYSGYNRVTFGRERDLERYVNSYPPGTPLCVRYNPTSPEASVILDADQLPPKVAERPVYEFMTKGRPQSDNDAGENE